jgi:hypothetical protein
LVVPHPISRAARRVSARLSGQYEVQVSHGDLTCQRSWCACRSSRKPGASARWAGYRFAQPCGLRTKDVAFPLADLGTFWLLHHRPFRLPTCCSCGRVRCDAAAVPRHLTAAWREAAGRAAASLVPRSKQQTGELLGGTGGVYESGKKITICQEVPRGGPKGAHAKHVPCGDGTAV